MMSSTTKVLLDRFVRQSKVFVFGDREKAAAIELCKLELFRMEAGMLGGVNGFWLSMNRYV